MRPGIILGTNLVVAAGALAWLLDRFGRPALELLARAPSPLLLLGFGVALAAGLVVEAWRWRLLLGTLGAPPPLSALVAYRTAGHTVAGLIPSARLGGEPLRVYLLVRGGIDVARAIASVGVDRTVEMGVGTPFALVFTAILIGHGVPGLGGALVSFALAALGLGVGMVVMARRLRRGAGVVSALASSTGLDRLRVVADRLSVVREAERETGEVMRHGRRLTAAMGVSMVTNVLVLVEYHLLLAAFGLPAGPIAMVAAIFATGAARSLPVPAGVGVLEGAQMWLFGVLGYPPAVGLAVGLAVRLRELGWMLPGALYLGTRGLARALRTSV